MCGIFGQINTKYDTFNYTGFCTLGVVNDVRGGDSVGVFIDGKTQYGIEKLKHFEDFMCASKLLEKTQNCRIAFGHCRKTSVGVTSLETAQPVVIRKKKVVEYVLMHNGTIYNTDELAKKYIPDVNIIGMSDSQVMAHIFYAGHYEALKEYNGSAVFAIIDYRKSTTDPLILFFKGESKKNEYSKLTDEERPLYFTCNKDVMYFSSIDSILTPLLKKEDVYTFETNNLYEYKNGDLYLYGTYDRSECCQTKITAPTPAQTQPSIALRSYDDYYDEMFKEYEENRFSSSFASDNDYFYPEPYNDVFPEFATFADIPKLTQYKEVLVGKDLLYYQKYKYNLLQGGIYISGAGFVVKEKSGYNNQYWFWQGILLKNKNCFDYLLRIQKYMDCDESDLMNSFPELIECLSALPVYDSVTDTYQDGNTGDLADGSLCIPFSKRRFEIKNGQCNSFIHDSCVYSGEKLLDEYKDYNPCTDDEVLLIVGEKMKD